MFYSLSPAIILLVLIFISAIKIVPEYERIVIFRLGRLSAVKGPGLTLIIPFIDRIVRVGLRTLTLDVPIQEVITKDNVPIKVNAVCYFRVKEPDKAIVMVEDYILATSQISQTTLRSVVGQYELDEVLSEREKINMKLQKIIDEQTDPWGIKVSIVEIKDVQIPEQMQRAIAHQAEAERDRRAKIINAEGELQASQKLADAAKVISENPVALSLRFLQTAAEIAADKNSTIIFPVPVDLIDTFLNKNKNIS